MKEYLYDTPEGRTFSLGRFATMAAAKRFMTRNVPDDYRALCVGPYLDEEAQ